jgi:hypothetical protein
MSISGFDPGMELVRVGQRQLPLFLVTWIVRPSVTDPLCEFVLQLTFPERTKEMSSTPNESSEPTCHCKYYRDLSNWESEAPESTVDLSL